MVGSASDIKEVVSSGASQGSSANEVSMVSGIANVLKLKAETLSQMPVSVPPETWPDEESWEGGL